MKNNLRRCQRQLKLKPFKAGVDRRLQEFKELNKKGKILFNENILFIYGI